MVGADQKVKASVIIPTRNRSGQLARCLDSLSQQSLPATEFEVIVSDNGSNDDTQAVASNFSSSLQLHYLFEPTPGLHVGRHAGLHHAKTELLLYCDDDIVANPRWVESVVEAFADPNVVLVGGNNLPLFDQTPPSWLQTWWSRRSRYGHAIGYLSILDFGQSTFRIDPGYIWGCNFSIRKQVLLDAGGFHPDGMPADHMRWRGDGETHVSAMIRKRGLQALFHSGASVHHQVSKERMSADYFQRRGFAQGVSDSFTDVRETGTAPSNKKARAHRHLKHLVAKAKTLYGGLSAGNSAMELRDIQWAALESYAKGYAYHQQEAAKDPSLLAWILKENYY
jgi:glucosyl-dolichyl phosphate glucuronosyltransferase